MCGIVGYSIPRGKNKRNGAFQTACDLLAKRGPDGSGIYEDLVNRIGVGHTRLSILDLSQSGHQPMQSADGRVVLGFNGEIYNFRELRDKLEAAGHLFLGHSDTEVLLQLYLAWRERRLSSTSDLCSNW